MNTRVAAILAVWVLISPPLGADEAEDILNKAVRAHGGETAMSRAAHAVRSMTGSMIFNGVDTRFTQELTCDLPHRYRLEMEIGAEKRKILVVVTPDKGWQVAGGGTMELTREHLKESLEEGHIVYLITLAAARRESGCKVQSIPDDKVQGKAVSGLKVSLKGRDDVSLYFDKESGLLVKMSRKTTIAGVPAERSYTFAAHKDFNGAKLPTRLQEFINGARYLDGTVSNYKFLPRPEDRLFAKP